MPPIDEVPGPPMLSPFDDARRAPTRTRWIVLGAVMLVGPTLLRVGTTNVMQTFWRMTGRTSITSADSLGTEWTGIGLGLVCACVVVALAPSSSKRKALSFIWMAAYLVGQGASFMWMFGGQWGTNGTSAIAWILSSAVTLGWWLTLRGRGPRAYWMLVVPVVVGILLIYLQGFWVSFLVKVGAVGQPLAMVGGLVVDIISLLVLWGSAWLAARIDRSAREAAPGRAGPDLQ